MKKRKNKSVFVKEEKCLNCGTVLHGKYCQECGQKAFLNKESFLHLAYEFTADYFHYDGKFWKTVKYLFTKPGSVTLEYIEGKRKSFLNPIQLYLFVSALFFLIMVKLTTSIGETKMSNEETITQYKTILAKRDSVQKTVPYKYNLLFDLTDIGYTINGNVFTLAAYDSIQQTLPASEKEHGLVRYFHRRALQFNDHHMNFNEVIEVNLPVSVINTLPKAMFFLLPVFGLIIQLFFRKRHYFDHIVFSLHYHVVMYMLFLIFFTTTYFIPEDLISFMILLVISILLVLYLLLSLKKVYQQGWGITTVKFLGILAIYTVVLSIALLGSILYNLLMAPGH